MSHPPLPPNFPLHRAELKGLRLWVSSDSVSAACLSERNPLKRKILAWFAAEEWFDLGDKLDRELPSPSLNHTRGDSSLYPCKLCRDAVKARKQIVVAYKNAEAWKKWGVEQP